MKISRIGQNEFSVALTRAEADILINAMNETLRELGPREFQIRLGAPADEVQAIIAGIAAAWR